MLPIETQSTKIDLVIESNTGPWDKCTSMESIKPSSIQGLSDNYKTVGELLEKSDNNFDQARNSLQTAWGSSKADADKFLRTNEVLNLTGHLKLKVSDIKQTSETLGNIAKAAQTVQTDLDTKITNLNNNLNDLASKELRTNNSTLSTQYAQQALTEINKTQGDIQKSLDTYHGVLRASDERLLKLGFTENQDWMKVVPDDLEFPPKGMTDPVAINKA